MWGLCIFYITILPIIAISEILQCENGDQFIIHCGKSQRRLHLIEFVLYFLAGCLLAIGWGILSQAIPVQQGLRGVGGGGDPPHTPTPSSNTTTTTTPPPVSSASVLPNNQLVLKMGIFHVKENNNRLCVCILCSLNSRFLKKIEAFTGSFSMKKSW